MEDTTNQQRPRKNICGNATARELEQISLNTNSAVFREKMKEAQNNIVPMNKDGDDPLAQTA